MGRVFCVHFRSINKYGVALEMPPRTVAWMNINGNMISTEKNEDEIIQLTQMPYGSRQPWNKETEPDGRIESMAHVIEGTPYMENKECKIYKRSVKKEAKIRKKRVNGGK